MELNQLIKKAKEVREKYSRLEIKKYGKSWTPAQIAEGLVGDIGDLMKLVMAKQGIRGDTDVDKELAHELSDCLWAILILADKYEIDIEKSFVESMNQLNSRIDEELTK